MRPFSLSSNSTRLQIVVDFKDCSQNVEDVDVYTTRDAQSEVFPCCHVKGRERPNSQNKTCECLGHSISFSRVEWSPDVWL